MKKTITEKSMTIENLKRYLNDLIKMGLVSEHIDESGNQNYKITKLGEKSGLEELPN